MKTKKGFISNSSTTSFLIWGVYEPNLSVDKVLNSIGLDIIKKSWEQKKAEDFYLVKEYNTFEEWLEYIRSEEAVERDGFAELFGYELPKIIDGFPYVNFEHGYDSLYIGSCPTNMNDEQTMGQWKAEVERNISAVIEGDFECSWCEEAYRDG